MRGKIGERMCDKKMKRDRMTERQSKWKDKMKRDRMTERQSKWKDRVTAKTECIKKPKYNLNKKSKVIKKQAINRGG